MNHLSSYTLQNSSSHSDSKAEEESNQEVSKQRIKAVINIGWEILSWLTQKCFFTKCMLVKLRKINRVSLLVSPTLVQSHKTT